MNLHNKPSKVPMCKEALRIRGNENVATAMRRSNVIGKSFNLIHLASPKFGSFESDLYMMESQAGTLTLGVFSCCLNGPHLKLSENANDKNSNPLRTPARIHKRSAPQPSKQV